MTRRATVFTEDAMRAFTRLGYEKDHQSGRHIILRHAAPPYRRLSIPMHRQLSRGALRALIRQAGLTVAFHSPSVLTGV